MAFGGEVYDGARTEAVEKIGHQRFVQNVSFDKAMSGVMLDVSKVGLVSCIGQAVERQNAFVV